MKRIEYTRRHVSGESARRPNVARITGTDGQTYEVSARIVSSSQIDGSPYDTPIQITTDASGTGTGSNPAAGLPVTPLNPIDLMPRPANPAADSAAGNTAGNAASNRAGAPTGGNGSGGIYPGPGGLPFNIPQPMAVFAALLLAGIVTLAVTRRS